VTYNYIFVHEIGNYYLLLLQDGLADLNLSNLLSFSMDGPNVNLKFAEEFDKFLHADYGKHLINVGSCGLHTVHNAVKNGFKIWNVDSVLRNLHKYFRNQPARCEDYEEVRIKSYISFCKLIMFHLQITQSNVLPKKFCGHRWLENEPVALRAIEVFENVKLFLATSNTADNETLKNAMADVLLLPRLHFFLTVARLFSSFLVTYQTDRPMIVFLGRDLKLLFRVSQVFIMLETDNHVLYITEPSLPLHQR
jgi:hypothetical protein